jgi:hypothetical protein
MRRESRRTSLRLRDPVSLSLAERDETEGRKPRPVAVGVRIARPKGEDVLVLFPITSQPSPDRFAVEIPEMEKRRIVGRSFHLEPEPPLGRFSKAFFLPLMIEFIARRAGARGVNRQR